MQIDINDLASVISEALTDYTEEIRDGMEEIAKNRIKEGVKLLRKSPNTILTGDYNKGWRSKKLNNAHYVLYNVTDYQLTHLLEDGHSTVDGTGRVNGIPHIEPVEKLIVKEYIKDVEKLVHGQ